MQALLPTDAATVTLPFPNDTLSNQCLDAQELQRLGDLLRVVSGPVEATLPARLAELVERLARREETKD
jgi:hypothetical protein